MWRTARPPLLALIAAITLSVSNGRPDAQQQTIKRTDLLKLDLAEMNGSEMNVWVADIAPGAQTGRHSHPTPRFVYVLEGAVVLELDGRSSQMFRAGEAFAEIPNAIHNLKNASTTEGARALGFHTLRKVMRFR
jgi:quercetin dioxygenase-like cupin family protein